jgi:uncharacterized phage protein (TIGR01671 family)
MRVRKFRAFVKQVNKMIYSENSYPKGNSDYRFVASEEHKKGLGVEYFTSRTEYVNQYGGVVLLPDWRVFTDEEAPVTEYTGLKDKTDREIYEKDIAEESYINPMTGKKVVDRYVIEWENGIHKMKYIGNQKGMDRYLWMRLGEIEIIGDVYRNPELLGAAE